MGRIGLTAGYTAVPEGTYVFQITEVTYKEDFGKLEITMETEAGIKHIERYSLLDKNNKPNTGAYNAFSYFAKTALDDFSLTEIDHEDLLGCFIECDVTHDVVESTKKPGETVTYVRLSDKRVSDGWEGTSVAAKTQTPPQSKPVVDLSSILG